MRSAIRLVLNRVQCATAVAGIVAQPGEKASQTLNIGAAPDGEMRNNTIRPSNNPFAQSGFCIDYDVAIYPLAAAARQSPRQRSKPIFICRVNVPRNLRNRVI